jgi:hypothetical protein
MEELCSLRRDGQRPLTPKRPWEAVDHNQSGLAGQWQDKQHQGKRLCVPDSCGDTNKHMQMTLAIRPLLSNAASETPGYMESSLNFFSPNETSGLLWNNDGYGDSALSFQPISNSMGDHFLQPASSFPPSSTTANGSQELWSFGGSAGTPEWSTGFLKTDSIPYLGGFMNDGLVHCPEDAQIPQTYPDFQATDVLELSNPSVPWNQHSKIENEMQLVPAILDGVESLNAFTAPGSWSQPNHPNSQIPELQSCLLELYSFDSFDFDPLDFDPLDFDPFDIPTEKVVWNQGSGLSCNILEDAGIQADDRSDESEACRALLLQPQQPDRSGGNFTHSSIGDKSCQTSYEGSRNRAPDSLTTTSIDDNKYPSRAESLLSTQFEKSALENGPADECRSFQPQVTPDRENHDNVQSERIGESKEVGYDTCFGMVRSLLGKVPKPGIR